MERSKLRGIKPQEIYATRLNTGVETVRKWEASGKTRKRPNGAAMKLISMIEKHGIEIPGATWRLPALEYGVLCT